MTAAEGSFDLVAQEIASRRSLVASMKALGAADLDFADDADRLAISLGTLVDRLRPGITGLCFFLAGDGGIDVHRCTGWTAGTSLAEWTDTARPAGKLRSAVLRAFSGPVEALGYVGLALRDGFREIGGAAEERAVAFGHRDGDAFLLGIHGPKGFRLVTPERKVVPRRQRSPGLPDLRAPRKASPNPRDWLVRASLLALAGDDPIDAAFYAKRLAEVGARADGQAIAHAMTERVRAGEDASVRAGDLALAAATLAEVGSPGEGLTLLAEACAIHVSQGAHVMTWNLTRAALALDGLDVLREHGIVPEELDDVPGPARSVRALFASVRKQLASAERGNAHEVFESVGRIAEELHERRETATVVKVAEVADAAVARLRLPAKGWQASSAFRSLALVCFRAGDRARAEALLERAERAAAAELDAVERESAACELREVFDEMGEPERQVAFPSRRDLAREVRAAVLRNDLLEAERLVTSARNVEERCAAVHAAAEALVARWR